MTMVTRCWGRRGRRVVGVWVMMGVTGMLAVASIKPLRNALLYPVWPSQWRPVGSLRILERHVVDLFYPMDRQPYSGSCDHVHDTLHRLHTLEEARRLFHTVHVHTPSSWQQATAEAEEEEEEEEEETELEKQKQEKEEEEEDAQQLRYGHNQHVVVQNEHGQHDLGLQHVQPEERDLDTDSTVSMTMTMMMKKKLTYFRPALTELEQRTLLRNLFVATSALEAFNVSYMAAEGTLIGALRHRGLIPWDDDADLTFRADQWATAKRVLSCVPGYQVKIYSDFLWKFYSLDSPLWTGEKVTRFPYIDLFPYVEDEDYVWPLVIWLKDKMLWPRRQVFPTRHVPFENFRIRVPNDVTGVLTHLFGDVSVCEARLFERREKRVTSQGERVRVPCSVLRSAYPIYDDWESGESSTS